MISKKILFSLGWPLSPLYEFIMHIRGNFYTKGIFKQYKVNTPVISIGNLTMGGTGKTPTVCYLATLLQDKGFSPAVISRGYTGKANKNVNVVSDKEKIYLNPHLAGDEPYMLAKMLPGVPILTGKKRYHTCDYATKQLGCDILILDDGFQHLKVKRDFDIVLFDKSTGFGVDRVFPGGDLRESKKALNRANLFLITGFSENDQTQESVIEYYLKTNFPTIPLLKQIKTASSYFKDGDTQVNQNQIPTDIGAFCGIANPNRFKDDLIANGFNLRFFTIFEDHHRYNNSDISKLSNSAQSKNVCTILTTDKDMVKIDHELFEIPCITVRLNTVISSEFEKIILTSLNLGSKNN